jgi:Na+/H+ antiporter
MLIFETLLILLLGAALLSMLARAICIPYPTLLALGGGIVALMPGLPSLSLSPELILALFVAPILLDAAHDASLRDLKRNWRPISSLILVAVGLTTAAVAVTARWLLPDMPWAAAIALGALLAPPDVVAALAVMRQVSPPHRIRTVLEGESLLNDASSLLIYKLAVVAVATGGFTFTGAAPAFFLVVFGSAIVGWVLARLAVRITARISDAPTATVIQFVSTFGVWLIAEHFELSGVVTVVVFGLTAARRTSFSETARVRIVSFATWETVTFVLNVLAFTLIGLQLGSILEVLSVSERAEWLFMAGAVLVVVILVRLSWLFVHVLVGQIGHVVRGNQADPGARKRSFMTGLVVGWSGMRGIVTLAAALALPEGFPYRDFILTAAFTVVLGTLLIQGLTLRPLLLWLRLPDEGQVESELALARACALKAAMDELNHSNDAAAERLKQEYRAKFAFASVGGDPHDSTDNRLRRQVVPRARQAIVDLRGSGRIGDEAYRQVEQELDWLELTTQS